jgi:hypothetical protein
MVGCWKQVTNPPHNVKLTRNQEPKGRRQCNKGLCWCWTSCQKILDTHEVYIDDGFFHDLFFQFWLCFALLTLRSFDLFSESSLNFKSDRTRERGNWLGDNYNWQYCLQAQWMKTIDGTLYFLIPTTNIYLHTTRSGIISELYMIKLLIHRKLQDVVLCSDFWRKCFQVCKIE